MTDTAVDTKETVPKVTEEEIDTNEVINQWLKFCAIDPETHEEKMEWYKEKQKFWKLHQTFLSEKGFDYNSGIVKALDFVHAEKKDDMEGCLLIVKIGSEERMAGPAEVETAYKMILEALDGVKGIRVIVTHHLFDVQKVSLPQLRNLQSEVLASCDPNDEGDTILRTLEL